jgi:hypothetical protein
MFASSIWTASPTIGENGSSRGTNDHLDYLLGSSCVICWLVAGLRPYPDFAPCFAARLASSRNVFAIGRLLRRLFRIGILLRALVQAPRHFHVLIVGEPHHALKARSLGSRRV